MRITDLPEETRLIQLAEEASELSQAALKLVRAMHGDTPVPEDQARNKLLEEIADTRVCTCAIMSRFDEVAVEWICKKKIKRWEGRINANDRNRAG